MEQLKPQVGFNPEKEKADASPDDWFLGVGEELKGVADALGIMVNALYAWPQPVNGIYPRVGGTYNHAIILIQQGIREVLPVGEIQRGREDFMDCASRAPVNNYETQFTYAVQNKLFSDENIKWLKDKGYCDDKGVVTFSDRFIAIMSNTTRNGNSLKAPNDAVRWYGMIPKKMLPKDPDFTWDEYHDKTKITTAMKDLGKEFTTRFTLNYEKVTEDKYPIIVKNNLYEAYDNYVDQVDGDYVKRLAPNYDIMVYGYRNTVNEVKKNDMTVSIEVVKQKGTPNYLIQGKDGLLHRIGDEKTFAALVGSFNQPIEEAELAPEAIGEPLYLGSSFLSLITSFFTKLKGKK